MKSQANIDVYMQEYTRDDTIAKYISETAGDGIAYVLQHVYAPVYLRAIRQLMAVRPKGHPFRVLEYGCGGGMNLLRVVELLRSEGANLEHGFGVDFSPPMIDAARREAETHLSPELNSKLTYAVAGNENLANDLARELGVARQQLEGTFDLIVGVNTTRYAHRLDRENALAKDILEMLRPAGQTIMIDMNRYFPLFRSRLREKPVTQRSDETYIPSLKEYTRPFKEEGFEIMESRNFCWIPHSANPRLLKVCRAVAPILDLGLSPLAMRSLVIARKAK
jgi:SAM-dependent methyltransferase